MSTEEEQVNTPETTPETTPSTEPENPEGGDQPEDGGGAPASAGE